MLVLERIMLILREGTGHDAAGITRFLAETEMELVGFACAFPDEHPTYGAYLDNLHVVPQRTGQGIGRRLLSAVAERLLADERRGGLYWWVIEQNIRARRFYSQAGAW